MFWHQTVDKPLSETVMAYVIDTYDLDELKPWKVRICLYYMISSKVSDVLVTQGAMVST